MKQIDDGLQLLDRKQQRHTWLGFPYAVIKKFGDDEASYQAALITYYGFLSLFPLLLVATSVISLVARGNAALQARVLHGIGSYFPVIGPQLERNIHSTGKSGLALVVGLLLTLYGARGVADAFQHALNHIWHVPKNNRAGFPKTALKSLSIILVGGLGLIVTAMLSSVTGGLGHLFIFKVVSVILSILLLVITFSFLLQTGTSLKLRRKDLLLAATISSVGIVILQAFGSYLVTNQLKNLSSLYGTFAVVLGLLFWIYLQVEVVLYAVEISTVSKYKLWPRSLTQKELTPADKQVYALSAKKERVTTKEKIKVNYREKKS
jgi:YihY family inner membrane protein